MSVFRPAARTTAPDGRAWEIYAYRIELPRRRKLRSLPAAALRALRSDVWTIEAATFGARPESHRWRTSGAHRRQVLAQVEGGLARGEAPRPRNADYLG